MKYFTRVGGVEREYRFERRGKSFRVHTGDRVHELDLSMIGDGTAFSLLVDGESHDLVLERVAGAMMVQVQGERIRVEVQDERSRAAEAVVGTGGASGQQLCAIMPGVIVDVLVEEGDTVEAGQTVLVLEAMKMQNPMQAEGPGVVSRVIAKKGVAVAGGELLIEIEAP